MILVYIRVWSACAFLGEAVRHSHIACRNAVRLFLCVFALRLQFIMWSGPKAFPWFSFVLGFGRAPLLGFGETSNQTWQTSFIRRFGTRDGVDRGLKI